MRAERAQISQRFNQVRLALTVVTDKEVRSRLQFEVDGTVVSEVGETETRNNHDEKKCRWRIMRLIGFLDSVATELVTEGSDGFHRG